MSNSSANKTDWKKKTAYIGILLALALICSYVESLIPFSFGIPGVKLGLTNLVIVMALYCIGTREAVLISVLRILVSGFLFGNLFSILYSLAGALLSFLVMWGLKKTKKLKCVTVSMAGGIFHNIGQILVAAAVVENFSVLYYVPILLVSGLITGLLIGILAQELVIRIGDRMKH